MSNLNEVLTLPSIRAELDKWLKSQPWSGNQGFKNQSALSKLEKIVITLHWNLGLELDEALNTVCNSAEGIIAEIYDLKP